MVDQAEISSKRKFVSPRAAPKHQDRVGLEFVFNGICTIEFVLISITFTLFFLNEYRTRVLYLPIYLFINPVLSFILFVGILRVTRNLRATVSGKVYSELGRQLMFMTLSAVAVAGIYFGLGSAYEWLCLAFATGVLLVLGFRLNAFAVLRAMARQGRFAETAIVVGATDNAKRLIERGSENPDLRIVGVFDDRLSRAPQSIAGVPVLGRVDDLLRWPLLPQVDTIIITVTSTAQQRVKELIAALRVLPQKVVLLLDLSGFDPENINLGQITSAPAAYISGAPVNVRQVLIKRFSDLLFGSLLLVGFAPLMAVIAVLIKLDSKGKVIFQQERHGFNNNIIRVFKFRTMRGEPVQAGKLKQVQAGDARVTRVGRILRATGLDELPQLFNVLRGEMSLVGPRPHAVGMMSGDVLTHNLVAEYAHRHRVKPGLTGWAQINGSRGPIDTPEQVRERIRLDLEYINRRSFWFDVWIMLATAPLLLGDKARIR